MLLITPSSLFALLALLALTLLLELARTQGASQNATDQPNRTAAGHRVSQQRAARATQRARC